MEGWNETLLLDELQSAEFRGRQYKRLGYGIVKSFIMVRLKTEFCCCYLSFISLYLETHRE